jgi:hypothetical protein
LRSLGTGDLVYVIQLFEALCGRFRLRSPGGKKFGMQVFEVIYQFRN